jgi:hypothetical protein
MTRAPPWNITKDGIVLGVGRAEDEGRFDGRGGPASGAALVFRKKKATE